MKNTEDIKIIFIENTSVHTRIAENFKSLDCPFIEYADDAELSCRLNALKENNYKSKEILILKSFNGRFFQTCPGSPGVICCNYRVINTCFNCLYSCAYCFLGSYLNSSGIQQFTNIEKIFKEIDQFLLSSDSNTFYRIGSGQFTDSLMMDKTTGIAEMLITRYCSVPNLMIEFKTKSENVDHLLNIKNKGNAVFAWSLSTERNIIKYEKGTASLEQRINAAARAAKAGYYIAFHFDPVIIYSNWKHEYEILFEQLFSNINPEKIVWISIGAFRYTPAFKEVIRNEFPDEEMTVEEMFPGIDGKMRYLKSKRKDIYITIKNLVQRYTDKPFIYLCMETPEIWASVFNKEYTSSEQLEKDFSSHLMNNIR